MSFGYRMPLKGETLNLPLQQSTQAVMHTTATFLTTAESMSSAFYNGKPPPGSTKNATIQVDSHVRP